MRGKYAQTLKKNTAAILIMPICMLMINVVCMCFCDSEPASPDSKGSIPFHISFHFLLTV